ncbi:hypothetical protein [Methylobacterium indicum]|uniref:Uncharacterized protein n=1 Tax=Methylobacterium indicum TaxID=1775910 RepID=A0A8H9C981_9HYPH|nr:hypothetical protein [Methylobacterium indicum]BCM87917.1 hypothetical protein mvi_63780 [Methylobacterium indicum]
MKYGEVQAIVQLAVALNVGVFALKELAVPYFNDKIQYLERFCSHTIVRCREKVENSNSPFKSAMLAKIFDMTIEKSEELKIAKANRDTTVWHIQMVATAGIIGAVLSLYMLYHTSVYYNEVVPYYFTLTLIFIYLPIVLGTGFLLLARLIAYGVYQRIKRDEKKLDAIIEIS